MDQNIVFEALSALTGFTVKPSPAGESTGGPVLGSRGGPVLGSSGCPVLESIGDQVKCLYPQKSSGSSLLYIPPLQKDMDKKKETSINVEEFFSPGHNYDFRGSENPSECLRGGEPYTRPWGWYALKVKDKYPEGNTWLGSPGWRDDSSTGECPVSFHGTGLQGAIGITEGYYKPGPREKYGYGIYPTPDIKTAEAYALKKKFTFKTSKTYEVVMQNRINPEKRERTKMKDYWLIKIDPNAKAEEVKKIVTESIRP